MQHSPAVLQLQRPVLRYVQCPSPVLGGMRQQPVAARMGWHSSRHSRSSSLHSTTRGSKRPHTWACMEEEGTAVMV